MGAVMGKRSAHASTEAEVAALSLDEVNRQIWHAKFRLKHLKLSSSLRKSSFERLCWLEREREKLHGITAPRRKWKR
jgi:hypothetical protein